MIYILWRQFCLILQINIIAHFKKLNRFKKENKMNFKYKV